MKSIAGAVLALLLALAQNSAADEAGLKALASGGHVAIIRHALTTPGTGDPLGFKLDDCATQRNLNDQGREEARKLGRLLRDRGIAFAEVLSSEWCRCVDTAKLLDVGEVRLSAALNNLFGRPQNMARQTREMRTLIAGWKGPGNLLLVTHGATLGAFMGVNPETAAGVVLKPAPGTDAGYETAGTISPDG